MNLLSFIYSMVYLLYRNISFLHSKYINSFMAYSVDATFRETFPNCDPKFSLQYFMASAFIFYLLIHPKLNVVYDRKKESKLTYF